MWKLVSDGFKEFSSELVKEAQETVKDSVTEGSSLVKEVASNVKDINHAIRKAAVSPISRPSSSNESKANGIVAPTTGIVTTNSGSTGSLPGSSLYDNDTLLDEYISESRRLSPPSPIPADVLLPPRAASTAFPASQQDWWDQECSHSQLPVASSAEAKATGPRSTRNSSRRSDGTSAFRRTASITGNSGEDADGVSPTADAERGQQRKRGGPSARRMSASVKGQKSSALVSKTSSRSVADLQVQAGAHVATHQNGPELLQASDVRQQDFEDLELDADDCSQAIVGPLPPAATQVIAEFSSSSPFMIGTGRQQSVIDADNTASEGAAEETEGGAAVPSVWHGQSTATQQLEQLRQELSDSQARAAQAEHQAEAFRADLVAARMRADQAHEAAAISAEQAAQERKRVQALQVTLEAERVDRAAVVAELQEELQQLKSKEHEDSGQHLGDWRSKCLEAEARIAALEAEAQEQEVQVAKLADSLEANLGNMQQRLSECEQERDTLVAELQAVAVSKADGDKALQKLKALLEQSTEDRQRLHAEAESLEMALRSSREEVCGSTAALERQRKEYAAVSKQLAQLKEQQEQSQACVAERTAMEIRLSAMRDELLAAHEARRQAEGSAEAAQQAAAAAARDIERAERERDEAVAQAQAAESLAAEERAARAEAQSSSNTLKAETDRRAALFHNAVRSAVDKVQARLLQDKAQLESRAAAAEAKLQEADQQLAEHSRRAAAADAQAAAAEARAREAGAQALRAQQDAEQARQNCTAAIARAEEATSTCMAAEEAAASSGKLLQELQQEATQLRSEASRTAKLLELCEERHAQQLKDLEAKCEQWKQKAYSAETSLAAASSRAEAQLSAAAEARQQAQAARSKLLQLEQEYHTSRDSSKSTASTASAMLPSKDDILSSLGLDSLGLNALLTRHWGAGGYTDIELGAKRTDEQGIAATNGSKKGSRLQLLRGVVGIRTWMLIAYMAVLHVIVMAQFSRRHVDLEAACAHLHPHTALP